MKPPRSLEAAITAAKRAAIKTRLAEIDRREAAGRAERLKLKAEWEALR